MKTTRQTFNLLSILTYFLRWTLISIPVALIIGSIVAFFLWFLELLTQYRFAHTWLLYFLPVAGVGIHFLYKIWGKDSERGNNLIIDEIHKPGVGVPAAMAPLIVLTTFITHLFGGSAGREGTAVQVGGSMAQLLGKWLKLNRADTATLLKMGIAAGFGAVFGTPITGAVFALEVLVRGRAQYNGLFPCLLASIMADLVCGKIWGINHTHYAIAHINGDKLLFHVDGLLLLKILGASAAFGVVSYLFAHSVHYVKNKANELIKVKWLIPVLGGIIIIGITTLLKTNDYSGIGVTTNHANGVSITDAFHASGATNWSWAFKFLLTVITLGMGFKGGEVTPLFFIGATLGNTLAVTMGAPIDLFAALGFIAVFAGATNTPIACTLMGIELFGGDYALYFAVACFTAYFCSGNATIYSAQPQASLPHFSEEERG